jgi:hypothetical protein
MPSHLSVQQILSQPFNNHNPNQYRNNEDENEKLLLDEAEQSFNRIVNTITNKCINKMPGDIKSLSQISDIVTQNGLSLVKDGRNTSN